MTRWARIRWAILSMVVGACVLGEGRADMRSGSSPISSRAITARLLTPSGMDARFPDAYYDYLLNGLQVIILERPDASEALLSLMIKSGAAFDRAGKSGTAALTARAIWLGAEDLSEATLRQRLAALEATIRTEVTWDATTISVEAPARSLPELIRLMARVVSRPTFPPEALAALKARFLDEVRAKRRDPSEIANEEWYRALYHPHPYARPAEGVPEEIEAITPIDIARHHARFFIANNATLIVLSPFSPATLMPIIRPNFGAMLKGKIVPPTFVAPAPAQGVRIILRDFPDTALAHIRIGSFGLERFSEEYISALVLAEAICLRYERESSKAGASPATARCQFDLRTHRGPFLLSLVAPNEQVMPAIERALEILKAMRAEGPTAEEFAEAQRRWAERFAPSALAPRQSVEMLHFVELYGLGRDYVLRFPARVQRATREEVMRVAEKYLSPNDLLIVIVGRAQGLAEALKPLGTVEVKTGG
ncbi:MAG: insulinase family protein [Blastocatellia bacterium]|nr:insulinase family protein [Blastocatellia bacterium]MCS7156987.1 insulinase family protein [Blastocatellia bacterium]MCX7752188.1 insulinase family protein [Blastocatellia bacterium]MDW8167680.1 pitrilysin family protein [Acidobacteriota bacterium]MDW8256279.1 pitrilysin family protein [Acidobacteriota bacterium]